MAQGPPIDLRFEHLSRAQGLSNSDITCFAQDNDGFFWIGTQDGLNRYDGHQVTVYRHSPVDSTSLADNSISCLYVDRQGRLWVGTENNGLSRYRKELDRFENFPHLPEDPQSLSYHYVTSITETSEGQLWVGTLRGLNAWQPTTQDFERFFSQSSYVMAGSTLDSLVAELDTASWKSLATLREQKFTDWPDLAIAAKATMDPVVWNGIAEVVRAKVVRDFDGAYIRRLVADVRGGLWIGYEREGLAYFVPGEGVKKHYRYDPEDSTSLSHDEVYSLCLDGPWLWVGTRGGGLNRLAVSRETFERYPYPPLAGHIKEVLRDEDGIIWAGDDLGLTRYDARSNRFTRYQHHPDLPNSLSASLVNALYQDQQANLWVGCLQGGVNLHVPHQPFHSMQPLPGNPFSLTKGQVTALLHDSQGRLWVGYYQTGIDVFSADRKSRRHIPFVEGVNQGLGEGTVFRIFEDRQGHIWIGTYRGGLQRYQEEAESFISYRYDPDDPDGISGNDVRDIAEDAQGRLWLAIHGGGVCSFDPRTELFEHWRSAHHPNQRSLADDWVFCLEVDRQGQVVVGSVQGVSWLNPQDGTTRDYNQANSSLAHNRVRSMAFDGRGRLWVGTENGLSRWQPEQEIFTNYGAEQGLPNSFIDGIIEDPLGKLWLSTNDGLVRLHPDEGAFEHYTKRDGLQGPEFFPGAYTRSEDGTLYFGGQQGVTWLTPSEIIPNRFLPPVHLTDFKLFNAPVTIGTPGSPLQQHVSETQRITLEYNQNFVGFEFVALNLVRPEKNRYAYRLEGLEELWNPAGNRHEASYTNLSPGKYTFRVRGANNDGLWNPEEASVELVIRPPWWRSPWAYGVYVLFSLLGLSGFRQLSLNRERLKNSLALAKVEAEKERELDRMKLKFFANVSHEFRTPLTLLIGPLEKLLAEASPGLAAKKKVALPPSDRRKLLRLMERNGQRLLRLINQLLDLTELEAGFMALRVSEGHIQEFSKTILEAFEYRATHKHITAEFSAFPSRKSAWFDADKLEKILYNLLSNAFKFTPEGGTIRLSLSQSTVAPGHTIPVRIAPQGSDGQRFVCLVLEDSGPGIPEEERAKVFDRFYQVSQTAYKNPGTGIGLALTRELVERHYGDISINSSPGNGTRITVWLPVSKQRYTEEEITQEQLDLAPRMQNIQSMNRQEDESAEWEQPMVDMPEGEDLPTLLVVEDNPDIREFIRLECQDNYRVIEARDGEEGLAVALAQVPDVVISDVMMPKLDGLELCKLMKADHRTSHIPMILLTARSSEQYTLQGLATGADDYITKPFSVPVLKARMQNLLDTRKRLQFYYSQAQPKEPVNAPAPAREGVSGAEEAFLAKARSYIEEHLADADLNPDNLAQALLMSRAQLYKKLKALTGLSVSIFVRHVRLAKALILLQEDEERPVGEVGYFVGFSDPGYFTKCFKERYGMAPSEARRAS